MDFMSDSQYFIRSVDRLTEGLVLTFNDGRVVLFSNELLNRMVSSAEVLPIREPLDKGCSL